MNEGLKNLSDIVALIKTEIKPSTAKFQFFIVEEFGQTERVQIRNELVIPQITKIHSIVMSRNDLVARWWTCLECRTNQVCEGCKASPTVSKSSITQKESKKKESDSEAKCSDEEGEENIYDSEDNGYTDQSDSDSEDSNNDDDDDMGPGDIVWALYGRIWYPARLCDMVDVPESIR